MGTRVPYTRIHGLPDQAVFELERNFEALGDAVSATSPTQFDAIVDPSLAADNTSLLRFKTVFSAIKYVADTLLVTNMVIGIQRGTTTETGNYGGSTSNLVVRLLALGNVEGRPISPTPVTWALGAFADTAGKIREIVVTGVTLTSSLNALTQPVFGTAAGTTTVALDKSVYVGTAGGALSGTGGVVYGYVSRFTNNTFQGSTVLFDCEVLVVGTSNASSSGAWPTSLFAFNTNFWFNSGASGALTITVSGTTVVVDGGFVQQSSVANRLIFSVTSATTLYWRQGGYGIDTGATLVQPPDLIVTSAVMRALVIEGHFTNLTIPAMAATAVMVPTITARVQSAADITGPAVLNISFGGTTITITPPFGVRLRGSGFSGAITCETADDTSATAHAVIDLLGVLRSSLVCSVKRVGALSSGVCKSFNIDATSANNVLIMEADTFNGGSTNASASTLVITDSTTIASTVTAPTDYRQAMLLMGA